MSLPVFRSIPRLHNAGFNAFTGIHARSTKEPDFSITPNMALYPSIIFECGWSESFPCLRSDKDLWIHGFGGNIKLVILVKFNKLAEGRVSGIVEVWAGDAAANDQLIQTEVIANLPCIFMKTAIDNYSISFLPRPPHLLLPSQYESPGRKSLGVSFFLGATRGTF